MTKYVCTVCGYIAEGSIPEFCPVCKAPASKFIEKKDNTYVTEHVVGIAKDAPEEILQGLRENFNGECSEVGMYLAMSRVADREGYPEIAEAWKRYAFEEAEHASKFAELLGEVLTDSTQKNLQTTSALATLRLCKPCQKQHPDGTYAEPRASRRWHAGSPAEPCGDARSR